MGLTILHLSQSIIPSLTLHTHSHNLTQSLTTHRKSITHNPSPTTHRNLPTHNLSQATHSRRILLTLTTHNNPNNPTQNLSLSMPRTHSLSPSPMLLHKTTSATTKLLTLLTPHRKHLTHPHPRTEQPLHPEHSILLSHHQLRSHSQ